MRGRERGKKNRSEREKRPGCVDLSVSAKPVLNVDGRDDVNFIQCVRAVSSSMEFYYRYRLKPSQPRLVAARAGLDGLFIWG